jgi:hypothetical protein
LADRDYLGRSLICNLDVECFLDFHHEFNGIEFHVSPQR